MNIRTATIHDLPALSAIERACFPPAEAATEEAFAARLAVYPDYFWLVEEDGEIVSFVNGLATSEPHLRDEMYEKAALHEESGSWQMIFGVNTLPQYRRRGLAAAAIDACIEAARKAGRQGVVLTCKEPLLHYYARFGFVNEGVSTSQHGGVAWYQMRLTF